MADAILIVVNAICRCRRYSTAGNCCYVTQKGNKSLLDSREPSTSDIEASLAAQRRS